MPSGEGLATLEKIRGAADLAALWRELPVAVIEYPAGSLPGKVGLADLNNGLRALAWRQHCRALDVTSCAEAKSSCRFANQGICNADCLIPVGIGGGTPQWRMATLFLRWLPGLEQLRLIALGHTACSYVGWAARTLREQYGLAGGTPMAATRLADLEFTRGRHWHLQLVTPWIVAKNTNNPVHPPSAEAVADELVGSMRARAHKLTALCTLEPIWQRLGAHLAHHVADALLPHAFSVDRVHVQAESLTLRSRGNGGLFHAWTWNGSVQLTIALAMLPWLTIIALCGGGKNPDEGFGSVEVRPVQQPESTQKDNKEERWP